MNQSASDKKKKSRKQRRVPRSLNYSITTRDGAPDRMVVPLVYYDRVALTSAVSVEHMFLINSLYDPDLTGVGGQPGGYAQWSAFYAKYRVDFADVELTWINNSNALTTEILAIASNSSNAINTVATFDSAAENPFSKVDILSVNTGMNLVKQKFRFDLANIAGATKSKYRADDVYSGDTGHSPVNGIVLHLVAQDISFASNIQVEVKVKITFHSTLFDKLPVL
jgi:hypothetical protein